MCHFCLPLAGVGTPQAEPPSFPSSAHAVKGWWQQSQQQGLGRSAVLWALRDRQP